jgi:hypothetical protein
MAKRNIWKTVSIIFIVLFVLVVVGGLLKAYRFRHSDMKATDAQIADVKNIVYDDLKNKGEYTDGLAFRTSERIRDVRTDSGMRKTMEASLYNQSIKYSYIIDIDSGKILVYTKTILYDQPEFGMDRFRFFK